MKNNIVQIVSYNCQGLQSPEKRRDVFDYLKSKNYIIYCLQDTHFTEKDEISIKICGEENVCLIHTGQTKEGLQFFLIITLNTKFSIILKTKMEIF